MLAAFRDLFNASSCGARDTRAAFSGPGISTYVVSSESYVAAQRGKNVRWHPGKGVSIAEASPIGLFEQKETRLS